MTTIWLMSEGGKKTYGSAQIDLRGSPIIVWDLGVFKHSIEHGMGGCEVYEECNDAVFLSYRDVTVTEE